MWIRKIRTGLVHSIGMVYSGMGIPQGCQLSYHRVPMATAERVPFHVASNVHL